MMRSIAGTLCLAMLFACSSSEDDGDVAGQHVSKMITAAEGGAVEIGKATLNIPGGALASDTTITVDTKKTDGLPDTGSLNGVAYDFGPDGLQFLTPATLELPMDGTPGAGKEAVVSWLDGSTWVDLPSTVSGGKVTTQISHFTTFIVRFKNAGTVSCDFSACGGDITGTWTIAGMCAQVDSELFSQLCPTTVIEVDVDGTGTITFNDDSTYGVNLTISGSASIDFPKECTSGYPKCAGLLGEDENDPVCTGTPASGCHCTATIGDTDTKQGTYSTSGNTFTTDDGSPNEYCVDGNTLKVKSSPGGGAPTFVYTATR